MADSKPTILKDSGENNNISIRFEVGKVGKIVLKDMQDGDVASIEVLAYQDCDEEIWVPFTLCCGNIKVNHPTNHIFLSVPGIYRVVLTDVDDIYLTDPSRFEDVMVFYTQLNPDHSLENISNVCCSNTSDMVDDLIDDTSELQRLATALAATGIV